MCLNLLVEQKKQNKKKKTKKKKKKTVRTVIRRSDTVFCVYTVLSLAVQNLAKVHYIISRAVMWEVRIY